MFKLIIKLILFFSINTSMAGNWQIVPSNDSHWIKTINHEKHELLIAYRDTTPHFLLILNTDKSPPDKPVPIWLQIDRGEKQKSYLQFLEQNAERSIFRIKIQDELKQNYINRMIAGLNWSIYFKPDNSGKQTIVFSLKGFTEALNDLLIANDIDSLDPGRLRDSGKNDELRCYITSNITVRAFEYRRQGLTHKQALNKLEPAYHHDMIQNIRNITGQIYNMKKHELPDLAHAEKYNIFRRCMIIQKQ